MRLRFFAGLILMGAFLNGFAQSAVAKELPYRVEGEFSSDYAGYIYMSHGEKRDSSLIKERKFVFEGTVDYPTQAIFHLNNGVFLSEGSFFLENGKTTVQVLLSGSTPDELGVAIQSISGNKTAIIMSDLQRFFQSSESDPGFFSRLYAKLDKIFTENPRNQLCGMLLSDVATDNAFTYEQLLALYSKLDTTTQHKDAMMFLNLTLNKLKTFRIGAAFKNFGFPDAQGKMISTQQFRGSVLLVQFWGSWCGPCRQTNPYLVDIYQRFKGKGFQIMGVGLEDDRESWRQAIAQDGLTWPQTIAMGKFAHPTVKAAGVWATPNNYLIDKDGKLLAINVQPDELAQMLNKLFPARSL